MLVIRGGTIFTAARRPAPEVIKDGTIIVEDGRIAYCGPSQDIPEGAKVIDASGRVITPGLIDAHVHIGVHPDGFGWQESDVNEATDPNTAEVRALDGIWPMDEAFSAAAEGGVTCVQIAPGSANVIGGETVVIRTTGKVVDEMVLRNPSGLKAALGENPKRVYGSRHKMPSTRMGNAAVMRAALAKAGDYLRKKDLAREKPDKAPDTDLKLEAIARVLRGEIPLRVHVHRADDIMTAIRIAKEFNIQISLEHCTEGHLIVSEIKEFGAPATCGPSLTDKSKLEIKDIGFHTPVALLKAGVKTALITDHPVFPLQYLRLCAGLAVREGLDEAEALLSVTRYPAEIAGVDARVGSLERGKDADIVIWSGDPFEYSTRALYTVAAGRVIYRAREVAKE